MLSLKNTLFAGLVAAMAISSPALATPVDTFSGTLSFSDTSPPLNNLVYFTGNFATSPFSFTGGTGYTYTDKLSVTGFDLNLASVTQSDQVAVDVNFNLPDLASTSIGGTGSLTDVFHLRGFYYSDTGTITWGAPVTVNFLDGSVLEIKIDDISLSGLNGTATGSGNLTMTVQKVAAVPEPFTMSLFGAGLLGMTGVAAKRRKKRANA